MADTEAVRTETPDDVMRIVQDRDVRFIRTVSRHGYQFVWSEVTTTEEGEDRGAPERNTGAWEHGGTGAREHGGAGAREHGGRAQPLCSYAPVLLCSYAPVFLRSYGVSSIRLFRARSTDARENGTVRYWPDRHSGFWSK